MLKFILMIFFWKSLRSLPALRSCDSRSDETILKDSLRGQPQVAYPGEISKEQLICIVRSARPHLELLWYPPQDLSGT